MNQSLFYTSKNGQELGPFPGHEIQSLLSSGQLSESDFIYIEAKEDWITLQEFQSTLSNSIQTAQVIPFAAQSDTVSAQPSSPQTNTTFTEPSVSHESTLLVDFPTDHRYEFSAATQTSIPAAPPSPQVLTTLSASEFTAPPTSTEAPQFPELKHAEANVTFTQQMPTPVPSAAMSATNAASAPAPFAAVTAPPAENAAASTATPADLPNPAASSSPLPSPHEVFELNDVPSGDFQISLRYLPTQAEVSLPIHVDAGEAQEIKVVQSTVAYTADQNMKIDFFAHDRFGSIDSHHASRVSILLKGEGFEKEFNVEIRHGIASWICDHKTAGLYTIGLSNLNGLRITNTELPLKIEPGVPKSFELKTRENLRAGEPIQIQVVGKDEWGNTCKIERDQLKIELIPQKRSS